MMHLVYPISLKTISPLFAFPVCVSLYSTTGLKHSTASTVQDLFAPRVYISTCIVFLWSSCVTCVAQRIEPKRKTLRFGCTLTALFLFCKKRSFGKSHRGTEFAQFGLCLCLQQISQKPPCCQILIDWLFYDIQNLQR